MNAKAAAVTVRKGKLDVQVSGSGSVEPVTSQDVTAHPAKTETVDQVLVAANQEVAAGQQLVTFTDGSDPITAPVAGTMTSLAVGSGDRVTDGKVVAHITNYHDVQTVVQVDELDILKVKPGQTADIKVNAIPDHTYTGKVTAVANEGKVTNGVSNFDVTVHIDAPDSLKVGMTTEADILTDSKDNVLYVPIEAVHSRGGQKFVLIPHNAADGTQTAEQRTVQTGIHNENDVEITQGLQEGDNVELPVVTSAGSSSAQGSMKGGNGLWGGMGGMYRMSGGGSGGKGTGRAAGGTGGAGK
ncbi:efflux RND transporter periplasmic adaptor subunit [Gordoniibacillus kamchatkensis]|uniref:efflux RND transporter periplasmic adaptor subunit n=1 Tax=Gordoniibacillus kamchatkensis TaxID=1590651 RepID=UPI001E3DCA2B|nr:efflux RND transporter periplasmic adaptor subunit [Paenibacillus sp. VKM B-2647]